MPPGAPRAHPGDAETITIRPTRSRPSDDTADTAITLTVCTRRPVAEGTWQLGTGSPSDTDLVLIGAVLVGAAQPAGATVDSGR